MAHIRLDDKKIELTVGELWIEADDDAGIRFGFAAEKGTLAIITVDPRGTTTVRRATSGITILVNGVALGAEPAPLLHGDRIEVAGRQLRFSDDRKTGSTVLMPAFCAPAVTAPAHARARAGVSGEFRFHADEVAAVPPNQEVARAGGVKVASRSETTAADPDSEPRVIVGLQPPHPKRASVTRPALTSRVGERTEPATSSRGVPNMVWLAAAVLVEATVLLVLQDR